MDASKNLYQRAAHWFNSEFGFTAVPILGKGALVTWSLYQRPITADEIDSMRLSKAGRPAWPAATGLNGICGVNDLALVDFDHVTYEPIMIMIDALAIRSDWLVATPSGGAHLWLRVPDLAGLIIVGKVDLNALPEHADGSGKRAHVEIRHKGHYGVLPPSLHPDYAGQYRFVHGWPKIPPPTVDPELLINAHALVTVPKSKPEPEHRSAHTGAIHAPTADRAIFIAKNCLDKLAQWRCDDYDAWIGVGMALVELDDQGLMLWNEWSQRSTKYSPGVCEKAWKYLAADGINLGKLVEWAHEDRPSQKRNFASVGIGAVDLKSFLLPSDAMNAIAGYAPTYGPPRPVTDRSDADWVAIKWLIKRGATDSQIVTIFKQNPIGQRGKLSTDGDGYLADTIAKARQKFVTMA